MWSSGQQKLEEESEKTECYHQWFTASAWRGKEERARDKSRRQGMSAHDGHSSGIIKSNQEYNLT